MVRGAARSTDQFAEGPEIHRADDQLASDDERRSAIDAEGPGERELAPDEGRDLGRVHVGAQALCVEADRREGRHDGRAREGFALRQQSVVSLDVLPLPAGRQGGAGGED